MMKRLDINFQRANSDARPAGLALLVFSVLVAISLMMMQRDLENQMAELDAKSVLNENGAASGTANPDRDKITQAAFNQLNLPWEDVFAAVEEAANSRVLLLALEGEGRNRVIRITAEAPHADAMLAYLEELKRNGNLSGWRLMSHRKNDAGVLRFVIQADLPEGK